MGRGFKLKTALDLFCGGGGASKGLKNAGFDRVIGIDINKMPEYFEPKEFKQYDALKLLKSMKIIEKIEGKIDFIWASPPCQEYSYGSARLRNEGKKYPDLISQTRKLLLKTGKPFVIENVVGSPLRKDLILCGEMFKLKVIRHRVFEIHNFICRQPEHIKHKSPVDVGNKKKKSYYDCVAGHGGNGNGFSLKSWQNSMGIEWITNKYTLAQCVPPPYSEYIARAFLK